MRRAAAAARLPRPASSPPSTTCPAGLAGLVVAYELFDALPVRALRVLEDGSLASEGSGWTAPRRFAWVRRPLPRRPGAPRGARPPRGRPRAGTAPRGPTRCRRSRAGDRRPPLRGGSSSSSTTARRPAPSTVRPARTGRSRRSWGTASRGTSSPTPGAGTSPPGSTSARSRRRSGPKGSPSTASSPSRGSSSPPGIAGELTVPPGETDSPERAAERNAVAKLVMPGGMGESIRVLVAERKTGLGKSLISSPLV